MPVYDYDCAACGRRIEVVHGVYAPGPTHCPNCGSGPLRKAISAPAVHYKGSGWAKRDRRATVAPGTSKATGDSLTVSSETETDRPRDDKEAAATKEPKGSKGSGSGDQGSPTESATTSSRASGAGTATKTNDATRSGA
jgi:putative FmdB family regulatory protein